jgi:hypothetical protein
MGAGEKVQQIETDAWSGTKSKQNVPHALKSMAHGTDKARKRRNHGVNARGFLSSF